MAQKIYRPLYLLQGEETFFIDALSDYIESNVLTEDEKAFNQTIIYGKDADAETVVATSRRYPLMAERQVVIVKEAQELKNILQLQSYAEHPSPSTVLVLAYKYKRLAANTKLYRAIATKGAVLDSDKLPEYQVPNWI